MRPAVFLIGAVLSGSAALLQAPSPASRLHGVRHARGTAPNMWLNTVLPLQKDASPKANAEPGTKPLPQNALSSTLQALQNLNPLSRPSPDVAEVSAPETGRLFVVSNRLPFSVKAGEKPGDYEFVMSSGGLVSAMLGVMKVRMPAIARSACSCHSERLTAYQRPPQDDSMTWVGWPGVSADAESERTTIREQLAEHKCVLTRHPLGPGCRRARTHTHTRSPCLLADVCPSF